MVTEIISTASSAKGQKFPNQPVSWRVSLHSLGFSAMFWHFVFLPWIVHPNPTSEGIPVDWLVEIKALEADALLNWALKD
jgi:hypothetical protein